MADIDDDVILVDASETAHAAYVLAQVCLWAMIKQGALTLADAAAFLEKGIERSQAAGFEGSARKLGRVLQEVNSARETGPPN